MKLINKILVSLTVMLIKIYQIAISPYIGRNCRFYPSCSDYFIRALKYKGIFQGSLLGIYRIIRCNPVCRGGYDPFIASEK
jgi:putative membrane protein insertion efficiency factor